MMSKLIDYVDFLVIAILIALGIYVGWTAFASRPRVQTQAAAFEFAIANAAPTTTELLAVTPHCGARRQPTARSG
jgi:predicted negative regulator of RcsB-dependent stress response